MDSEFQEMGHRVFPYLNCIPQSKYVPPRKNPVNEKNQKSRIGIVGVSGYGGGEVCAIALASLF